MYEYYDSLKWLMKDYDSKDDYTFLYFGKDDKLAIEAKKEFNLILKLTKILFSEQTDSEIKKMCKLLEIDAKKLKHFIAREIN